MIKRSLGLLLVAVLLGAGLSAIASAAPSDAGTTLTSVSDQGNDALLVPQGSPTPSASGTPVPSPSPTGEPKKCPPKKGKGKKKKKGCPPQKPSAPACPSYTPGEQGAEAETSIVTDAATEDAPVEVTIATDAGLGAPIGGFPVDESSHAFHNIQVDSSAAETGLYVRWEFDTGEDYDIYLNNPDGSEAAHAAGFNPAPVLIFDGTGTGGHSEMDAEQLDGIKTADCQGYTLDITGFLTPGGDYTLTLWLGEATYPV